MIEGAARSARRATPVALGLLIVGWLAAGWWARQTCLPYDVNNTDVGTYLFQAETFARGKIWRVTPEPREFFSQWQAVVRDRSFAYYPPLPACALAIPLALGEPPFVVPWLASGVSLLLAFVWIARLAGRRAAGFGVGALAISPFFVANGLSLLSHALTLALTFAFLLAVERAAFRRARSGCVASGLLLAAIFASRPVNAAALALAWLPWAYGMMRAPQTRDPSLAEGLPPDREMRGRQPSLVMTRGALFLAGCAAGVIPLLLYYRALVGRWTLSLFTDYWPRNRFGFGRGLGRGEPGHYFQTYTDHDFSGFLANLKTYAVGLAEWWTGNTWLSGLLVGLGGLLIIQRSRRRRTRTALSTPPKEPSIPDERRGAGGEEENVRRHILWPLTVWIVAHIGLYAFYFTTSTPTTGPRYLAELMPALALLTGGTLALLSRRRWARGTALALFAGILAAQAAETWRFLATNRRGIVARRTVERCVREGAEAPALVFLRSFWIGHPIPIFRNAPDLSGPVVFACDRGAEDRHLVERFPDRNAYLLALTPENRGMRAELVPLYRARERRWLRAAESVEAPFFVGSRFTAPLRLEGETARLLFHPRPDEIVGQ